MADATSDVTASPEVDAEPTVNDIFRNLLAERSFRAIVGALEAAAGLIVTAFFTFGIVGMLGIAVIANAWIANYPRLDRPVLIALTVLWLPLLALEWMTFQFYAGGMARVSHPVPVQLALRQPHWPWYARVPVAAWWVAHAALLVLAAHGFTDRISFFRPTFWERALEVGVPVLFMFGSAFAMNTHLLIGLYALSRSERFIRAVAKVRFLLDVAVALLVPAIDFGFLGT
ncbi:MAG: hypothetical protein WBD40_00670 [Tepidisphaeraceae bacterium]